MVRTDRPHIAGSPLRQPGAIWRFLGGREAEREETSQGAGGSRRGGVGGGEEGRSDTGSAVNVKTHTHYCSWKKGGGGT